MTSARLVVACAAEGDVHAASHAADPTPGRGKLVVQTLEVRPAPGEHLTLPARYHVGALAEILYQLPEGNVDGRRLPS